jgi:hypothetical protein
MSRSSRWYASRRLWLEAFVLVNLAFLAPDIYLAHSMGARRVTPRPGAEGMLREIYVTRERNFFRRDPEYVPLYFSRYAPAVLLIGLLGWAAGAAGLWKVLGHLVGAGAVAVGVAGVVYHLSSRFFAERTLDSLVYTAPFAAPLAYTGLGLLLIMNRMVDPDSADWPRWVLLLALGGFVGNFIFSLADHAQNGFFHATEWIPVASSAFAVGFLMVPFLAPVTRGYTVVCLVVLLIQVAVGLLGFYLHNAANLEGSGADLFTNFIEGAPPLAPLLFPNLALLAFLGLWELRPHLPEKVTAVNPT